MNAQIFKDAIIVEDFDMLNSDPLKERSFTHVNK